MLGISLLVALIVLAFLAPLIAPFDPLAQDPLDFLQGPSSRYWFGTDQYGRDILLRLLYGARVS